MILDTLADKARLRVNAAKEHLSFPEIRDRALALPKGDFAFEKVLRGGSMQFICEVKRASPSKGVIAESFPYLDIAREYEAAGAAAISVLTEPEYFLGSDRYLREIKEAVNIPVLRKDFTVDPYQIYEAKLLGADAVLLICALLDEAALKAYLEVCDTLGLSALVETHNMAEMEAAKNAGARVVGVNSRDLKTFHVDLQTCAALCPMAPKDAVVVAESGIKTAADVAMMQAAGAHAALIGETLMRSPDKKAMLADLRGGAL